MRVDKVFGILLPSVANRLLPSPRGNFGLNSLFNWWKFYETMIEAVKFLLSIIF